MITAIDFGCHVIRSAFRSPRDEKQITMLSERAEYLVLPKGATYEQTLTDGNISYAECEDSLVVYGNRAEQLRWLSRKPCAPLFLDGNVPTSDAPARQILNILTQALLPENVSEPAYCCFTAPGGNQKKRTNIEFLSRLIRMHGYLPIESSAAEAVTLAACSDTQFTGITIVIGAESSQVSVTRHGVELATAFIDVGSNWIDSELATQFKIQTWDENGDCYLDLEAVRNWKHDTKIHLCNAIGERQKTLTRLYSVLLNRIGKTVRDVLSCPAVQPFFGSSRLSVFCAGGATQIDGFGNALTERLVDHDIAGSVLSVKVVDDPSTAVVRGLLIKGALEHRTLASNAAA